MKGNYGNVMDKVKTTCKGKTEIKIADLLYYIFLIIMFGLKGFGLYDGQAVYRIFFWTAMLCVVGKIFLTNYTKKEWFWIILLGILAVLIERNSGEKGVLITYAIVAGMKGISWKRILHMGAGIYGVTLCFMITFFGIFLDKSTYIVHSRLGMGDVMRYGLGYAHPNTLMVTYFVTCALIAICLEKKYSWKHAIALEVGLLYVYSYCISYTGLITGTLIIIMPLYLNMIRKGKLGTVEYIIGGAALPFSLAFSFISPYYFPEGIWNFFERFLPTFTRRFELAKQYVIPANISLLGTHVTKVTDSRFTLDNSFLYTFVFEGVLFFGIIIGLYFYMMYRLIKEKRNLELIVTCVFFVQAIMEPFMFNTSFKNITLFFLGELIWDKSESVEGRFDKIKIVLPNWLIKYTNMILECWKQNGKKVLMISSITGVTVLLICLVKDVILNSADVMTMAVWRSNFAIAWFITIFVAFICFGVKYRNIR